VSLLLALVTSGTTIECAQGEASASGLQAGVSQAFALLAGVGQATASGHQATVRQATTIYTNAGIANALGHAAMIGVAAPIACNTGQAFAQGLQASIQIGSDARLDQILALLTGTKIYDEATGLWRVYDGPTELADDSGVLGRGLHGWLLRRYIPRVDVVIPGEVGTAYAIGLQAQVIQDISLRCGVGVATARGFRAFVFPRGYSPIAPVHASTGVAATGGYVHYAEFPASIATVTQLNYNSSIDKVTNMAQVAKA
jgi:hypothetical protein